MKAASILALRAVGWAAFLGSTGLVVGILAVESIQGPVEGQRVWPTDRIWGEFLKTLGMAAGATVLAIVLAMPAAFVLAVLPAGRWRRLVVCLTLVPLMTMPSIFAYAWMLLLTRLPLAWTGLHPGQLPGEPTQAAVVMATWLWPVPALLIALAFRHGGAGTYRLALLDARPMTAFFRGALVEMRAPLLAAAATVFILSSLEGSIPPLVGAFDVWSNGFRDQAGLALGQPRPAAFLVWQAWPMLLTIGGLLVAALPAVRRMTAWGDSPELSGVLPNYRGARPVLVAAGAFTGCLTLYPLGILATELTVIHTDLGHSFVQAVRLYENSGIGTAIVGMLTGCVSVAVAIALLHGGDAQPARRLVRDLAVLGGLGLAVMPPELIGTSLVDFFVRHCDPNVWNVYDSTPWPRIAAMLGRFGIIPIAVGRLMDRRVPSELVALAEADGAGPLARLAHARLPLLWRPLLAAGFLVACLTMTEVSTSVLFQSAGGLGESIAVRIDAQMHYQREDVTVMASVLMLLPTLAAVLAAPIVMRSADETSGKKLVA